MGLVKTEQTHHQEIETVSALPELLRRLVGGDAAARRASARALADFPEAVDVLCDRLECESDPTVREVILLSLIRFASPPVAKRLVAALHIDDAGLRSGVIEALQMMPEALAPHVETLLADPDSDIRIFAVNILATVPLRHAPGWLVGVIERDTHVNVCAAAADALAEIGGPEAVEPLRALAARFPDEPFLAFAIETALRRIGVVEKGT
jgi:HEAT repeat protein